MKNYKLEPAFEKNKDNEGNVSTGLTKLDYFAAEAMKGLLSFYGAEQSNVTIAKWSVQYATQTLTELGY